MSDYELVHAYETVNLHRTGGAARIELNRPEKRNAWDATLARDLQDVLARVGADDEVRAVLITGAGRGFSSGADLSAGFDPADGRRAGRLQRSLRERYHPVITGIRDAAEARRRGGQRPGGRHRLLARARVRPRARRRVGLLPARVREHRAGARRRLLRLHPGARRARPGDRDGDARASASAGPGRSSGGSSTRSTATRSCSRPPTRSPAARRRPHALLRRRQAPAQRVVLPGPRGAARARGRDPAAAGASADFVEGVAAFLEKRPAAFTGR